jgi:hypothetical protein
MKVKQQKKKQKQKPPKTGRLINMQKLKQHTLSILNGLKRSQGKPSDMDQVVQHQPSKDEALSSNPSTKTKQNKKNLGK